MDIKYKCILILGFVVCVVLAICKKTSKEHYEGGKKVNGFTALEEDSYFKKKMQQYKLLCITRNVMALLSIFLCAVLIARPYTTSVKQEKKYSRDIILCMDVSTSVIRLNKQLIENFKETVKHLHGERVGIVVFNSTSVVISPMTDDYSYINEALDRMKEGCEAVEPYLDDKGYLDSSIYFNSKASAKYNYLEEGTLENNEDRGSSLIADGLASAAFDFPDLEKKRTRILLFATDNDAVGESLINLDEAAHICKENKIVVYGIGTENIAEQDKVELKACVEKTGGKLYVQGKNGTVSNIVSAIERQSKSMEKGKKQVVVHDEPTLFIILLVLSMIVTFGLTYYTEGWHKDAKRVILRIAMLCMILLVAIRPKLANGKATMQTKKINAAVLFVVDNTVSMEAIDGRNKNRMADVKEDCQQILTSLNGAKFSLITFNNHARRLMPFSSDSEAMKNAMQSLTTVSQYRAQGSSMNVVKDELLQAVKSYKKENHIPIAVFFLTDGEITNEDTLDSFAAIKPYIDYGAVMGYGTKKGAIMIQKNAFDSTQLDTICDQTNNYNDAISKIDESNLKKMAEDMGVSYVHMDQKDKIDSVLKEIQNKCSTSEADTEINGKEELYYLFAIPLFVLFVVFYYSELMRTKNRKKGIA